MNNITQTLFRLINISKGSVNYQDNLKQIKLLLNHSKEYLANQLTELAIEVNEEMKTIDGCYLTLLGAAIGADKLEVVEALVEYGMSVNQKHRQTFPSPLVVAARNNNSKIAEYLIRIGAEVNLVQDEKTNSPLIEACRYSAYEVVKCLLLNDADIDFINADSRKAIFYATKESCLNAITAAEDLKAAALQIKDDIFKANSSLYSAFKRDSSFAFSYLGKIAETVNLCGKGLKYNEAYYHPKLLKIAIVALKTFIKTIPNFSQFNSLQGYKDLIEHLNAYDSSSTHFDKTDLIFKNVEAKMKTLRWFEKGTDLESTKLKMKEKVYLESELIVATNSPIFAPKESSSLSNSMSVSVENLQTEVEKSLSVS